ncbi:MAG: tRNA (adenosine(37)-N6)-threonylcarbamoyltransferase complex transferase subunit TsaD [Candidatus Melainabacteria bacterium GWF2_37_15]|nr:MAG: tRNA (adenosine(37)-N6)-threonylcarbamoyltransferase complex transferase subunit TsaD [Candidatus Melainabacteria bacterium GWF2_37_15]
MKDRIIFAIETSCDETAAAVVLNGRKVLSNVVASQIDIHKKYGGVIPEIAARKHLESINIVIEEAREKAGIEMKDVTAFAGTAGPGLVGALLVGLNAAKALSLVYDKPFIGVNHLNAHVCANYLESSFEPPFICLLISGGHTQLIRVNSYTDQQILGETRDDAVGEAYDKVARLLGLPYPGGPALDKLAQTGNKESFKFPEANVSGYDFSFSGLKTAVMRTCKTYTEQDLPKADIAASFQEIVSSTLLKKTLKAANENNIKKIALAGGVAANSEIRKKFFAQENNGFTVHAPEFKYCTDNAAMVASAAYFGSNITHELNVEVFSRKK